MKVLCLKSDDNKRNGEGKLRHDHVFYSKISDMNDQNNQDTATTLKKNLKGAKEELESFIKEHPLAAAGIAALIGFVLARILKGRD